MNAYGVDKKFDLSMITKDNSNSGVYKQIAKLGFLLGGVGNRSRRGFGSIRETGWSFPDEASLQQKIVDTLNALAGSSRYRLTSESVELKHPPSTVPEYPTVQFIAFGTTTSDVDALLKKIGSATHKHKDDALGYANRSGRLASPIHVRIQKVGNGFSQLSRCCAGITQAVRRTTLRRSKFLLLPRLSSKSGIP